MNENLIYVFLGLKAHGNSTDMNERYTRTPTSTFEKINEKLPGHTPKEVYGELLAESSNTQAPRNAKQVRYVKSQIAAKQRSNKDTSQGVSTVADQVLRVINMARHDDFVKQVVVTDAKVPAVVLCTDSQIRDTKNMCCVPNGSVLSFDKTYNLGAFYVTASTYKNMALERVTSGSEPIFVGPLFVHGNSDVSTYYQYFSYIFSRIWSSDLTDLTLGSDNEKAMRLAMSKAFRESTQILCTRHLKTNVKRYLQEKVGSDAKTTQIFTRELFGQTGLSNITNLAVFDTRVKKLCVAYDQSPGPAFKLYVSKEVIPHLRNNAAAKRSGWTSNNCESVNAALKHITQWKPQQLPDLIELLRNVVKTQEIDAERAIFRIGEFRLQPSHKQFEIESHNQWQRLTMVQQKAKMEKCFRVLPAARNTAVSRDGMLTVNCSPTSSRKPGQRTYI